MRDKTILKIEIAQLGDRMKSLSYSLRMTDDNEMREISFLLSDIADSLHGYTGTGLYRSPFTPLAH